MTANKTVDNMENNLREIYDRFAETYDDNRGLFDMTAVIDSFYARLQPSKGALLDMGCGAGEPFARFFADQGWQVTGVDFSRGMLALAARYVPEMRAICADMRAVDFAADNFDAVTAVYSLFHIPRNDHLDLFEKFYRWLNPGGKVLFTYATKEYTGSEEFEGVKEFMGQQLFYSHKSPVALYADLAQSGLIIDAADYHTIGGETFLWITAGKP